MTEAAKFVLEKELVQDVISFEKPVLEKYLGEICDSKNAPHAACRGPYE
jgi:hypothetical protein